MKYFTNSEDKSCPFFQVEGWVNIHMPTLVGFIVRMLEVNKIAINNICEIGVHHGRFFLLLEHLSSREDAFCDALDVFDNQYRNLDGSGRGSLSAFKANIDKYARYPRRVRAFAIDSVETRVHSFGKQLGCSYDLISLDGCHTALHTYNDLLFAETHLNTGGLVFLDDINNLSFMGVAEGVSRYLSSGCARLVPLAAGLNKLLLTPVGDHQRYLDYFVAHKGSIGVPEVVGAPNLTTFHNWRVFRYS